MEASSLDAIAVVADAAEVLLWTGVGDVADRFSPGWHAYAGVPAGDWRAAVHADDRSACEAAWSVAVRGGAADAIELRLAAADGSYRRHRVRFVVVAGGRWFGVARAQVDADYVSRLEDRFLATVSHELRAPIAAVLLWERLLRERDLDLDDRVRALDAIRESAVTQSRLVDDLLDLARATTGKLVMRPGPIEIAPVLEHALDAVRPLARAKELHLDARIEPALGCVEGDATRLAQVVENVLAHAIKLTREGGHVALVAIRSDPSIMIEIIDDGCGVAPDALPHVFDMFRGLDRPDSGGDVGLGLAIAREVIALHRGTIDVQSDGRDRGTRFRIALPVASTAAEQPSRPLAARALANIKILVVDDDRRVLAALERLLVRAGGEVECARSIATAWEAIQRAVPDIVVSDIAMPAGGGYELVQRIRSAESPLKCVPAIALTAGAAVNDAERAIAAGFDGHLAKPILIDVLVASIVRLVRKSAVGHTR